MGFPEELHRLRYERGLSQKELADALGVSQASIGYWEKGQRTPSIDAVKKISDYFGVSLEDMVSRPTVSIDADALVRAMEIIGNAMPAPSTLAAHFTGDEYTEEELEEIRQFAEFVKSKRKK